MSRPPLILASALTLLACSQAPADPAKHAPKPGAESRPDAAPANEDARFEGLASQIQQARLGANPGEGVYLGLHEYDGKLPDVSVRALAEETNRLHQADGDLTALAGRLSPTRELERQVLLHDIRGASFGLTTWKQPARNPMYYTGALGLTSYISRDYAPIGERARGVIGIARGSVEYLKNADANLSESIPRTWLATALLQVDGLVTFTRDDVRAAFERLDDQTLKAELHEALGGMVVALESFARALRAREGDASDDYALGEKDFMRMLAVGQGVQIELATLKKVVDDDLAHNTAALKVAAAKIAPGKTVAQVVAMVVADKPDDMVVEATEQATRMRQFLIDHKIVTIPSEHVAEVKPSPPFMRWNFAFLDGAGPFEKKPLPSFYYISPPDPSWSAEKQRGYVASKSDLLFVTIHEVWPGHFLHTLHLTSLESKVLKSIWNYVMGEGWAHYVEQMMWDEGISEDERDHVGQLLNALLRNVRSVSAIGLHTGGMTVEQSKKLFMEKAYQDEANADQQAVRGTFDPMYLAYNIGKLMILKLRTEWMTQQEAAGKPATLQAFHDAFLQHGAAPIPVIRKMMLGEDSGTAL